MTLDQAAQIIRRRYNQSERTRADWVRYCHDIETLREIAQDPDTELGDTGSQIRARHPRAFTAITRSAQ